MASPRSRRGRPVGPDTLFEIGSIGKTFTALVVMQLAEEGRLAAGRSGRPAPALVPRPADGDRITIHHLLSHTAGITAGVDGTPEATFQVWRLRDAPPGRRAGPAVPLLERRLQGARAGHRGGRGRAVSGRAPTPDPRPARDDLDRSGHQQDTRPRSRSATSRPATIGPGTRAHQCCRRRGSRPGRPTAASRRPRRTWRHSRGCCSAPARGRTSGSSRRPRSRECRRRSPPSVRRGTGTGCSGARSRAVSMSVIRAGWSATSRACSATWRPVWRPWSSRTARARRTSSRGVRCACSRRPARAANRSSG